MERWHQRHNFDPPGRRHPGALQSCNDNAEQDPDADAAE